MRRFFAISLMPLLARLVLALALAPAGFRDAFGTRVFTPKETAVLVELGYDIGSKQAPPGAVVDPESLDPLQAPRWLGKALELHEMKVVPEPLQVAQWESVARLVAGTLLLIGFLSRLWAAAMLVTIGTQFALGPARAMAESLFYSLEPGEYQAGFVSLALCALALNVLLVGAARPPARTCDPPAAKAAFCHQWRRPRAISPSSDGVRSAGSPRVHSSH
jgi:uncharacterized membrane protein YphA (DoxX/SURF4 family)